MEFVKKHWKEILIVLLSILFVSNCTGKGNYERKYKAQVARIEYVTDSLNHVYSNASSHIDSLNQVIRMKDIEIKSLNKEIDIYKEQNVKLASKPVIVKVEEKKQETNEKR